MILHFYISLSFKFCLCFILAQFTRHIMLGGKRGGFVREDHNEPSFQIRPSFEKKFRPGAVKETIHQILDDTLAGKTYDTGKVADWSKDIADQIKCRIKEMGYDRYKVVLQCV